MTGQKVDYTMIAGYSYHEFLAEGRDYEISPVPGPVSDSAICNFFFCVHFTPD